MSAIPAEVASAAGVALAGHEGEAGPALASLRSPDPQQRRVALGTLSRLGVLGADQLEAACTDPDPSVRRRAAELAASMGDVAIDNLLDDPDPLVAEVAAWACGERGETGAVAQLCDMCTSHSDPMCREAAAAALGAIGDEAGLDAILAATKDVATVRRRAVLALAPFEGAQVQAALQAALEDRDWQVRQVAEYLTEADATHDPTVTAEEAPGS